MNRLLSVSGLAHGRSGVEVRKSGNAGDPNLLEAIGTGSSWTSRTPGQQLEALWLSHSTISPILPLHGNDDCIRGSRLEDASPQRRRIDGVLSPFVCGVRWRGGSNVVAGLGFLGFVQCGICGCVECCVTLEGRLRFRRHQRVEAQGLGFVA
jgi:hypothetical protein